jgi:hypothetical protein
MAKAELERFTQGGIYTYHFDAESNTFMQMLAKDHRMLSIAFDRNYDEIDDSINSYGTENRKTHDSYDNNYNGIFEFQKL